MHFCTLCEVEINKQHLFQELHMSPYHLHYHNIIINYLNHTDILRGHLNWKKNFKFHILAELYKTSYKVHTDNAIGILYLNALFCDISHRVVVKCLLLIKLLGFRKHRCQLSVLVTSSLNKKYCKWLWRLPPFLLFVIIYLHN